MAGCDPPAKNLKSWSSKMITAWCRFVHRCHLGPSGGADRSLIRDYPIEGTGEHEISEAGQRIPGLTATIPALVYFGWSSTNLPQRKKG